jgi:hypothetical protein
MIFLNNKYFTKLGLAVTLLTIIILGFSIIYFSYNSQAFNNKKIWEYLSFSSIIEGNTLCSDNAEDCSTSSLEFKKSKIKKPILYSQFQNNFQRLIKIAYPPYSNLHSHTDKIFGKRRQFG